jgi:hypothetical protein
MFGLESLSGLPLAAALIGIVLLEALVLYVGYGALQRVLGPWVMRIIRGD